MQIIRSLDHIDAIKNNMVVAVGVFDGVHRGHQLVVQLCKNQAELENAEPWVMTFDPHPLQIVQPDTAPLLLTSLTTKLDILSGQSIEGCMVVPFTHHFSQIEPESFLDHLVKRIHNLKAIVIGENWRFGRQARGDVNLLRTLSSKYGFHVLIADPVTWNNAPISSTRIREAVAAGRLDDAKHMLGRPYTVEGSVIHGQKRGRHLGFPTANLDIQGHALPPSGIYAAVVHHNNTAYSGALYLPAHDGKHTGNLEVHLIDFSGDLYDSSLKVEFTTKIRNDDLRFDDEKDLIQQIQKDVHQIRNVLSASPNQ